jgi:hypothetical protein
MARIFSRGPRRGTSLLQLIDTATTPGRLRAVSTAVSRSLLVEAFGVVDVLVAGRPAIDRLAGGPPLLPGRYVACNGNDGVDDFTTPEHTGAFLRATKGFRIADITDGLSNTFFVGDRTVQLSYCTWVGGPTGALNPFLQSPGDFGAEVTLLMCHAGDTGPNTPGVFDADSTSSPNRVGVPFLFGDGSVHFISNGIAIPTWMALATRAGNEPTSGGDY